MTSVIPQPIENYIAPLLSHQQQQQPTGHHVHTPTITQPSPIEYSYTECLCESCNYYRQSSMGMYSNHSSVPSTPTTPVSPISPFGYNPYAASSMHFPQQQSSFGSFGSYDQSSMQMNMNMQNMSMPLQPVSQNMGYYNQMAVPQQSSFGSCYPEQSSMMQCYPQSANTIASTGSMDPEAINHPVAYSLTEQFRQIVGSIVTTACTPRGRSLLQSVMRLQHSDKVQTIFEEIAAEASVVMLDANGCHVVRSIIEMLDETQVRKLVAAMNETTILNVATTSQYTRRILQVLFERHKAENLSSIVDVLATHALSLATTQQGCIALMRVIERCSAEQKEKILAALMPSLLDLATDPFGNYVVQSVLEHYKNDSVTAALKGHLLKLATNKFASNVMEKAFRFSAPHVRAMLIEELFDNAESLAALVQDGFGNFVIQAVIDSCPTQAEFKRISDRLRPLLHNSPYGHKIESKMRNKKFNANGTNVIAPKPVANENSENENPSGKH